MKSITLASLFLTSLLHFAPTTCQTTAPAGFHGPSLIGTGANGTNEVFGFVYPPLSITVNVQDIVIISWWSNATGYTGEFVYPEPVLNAGNGVTMTASVPLISTTAYTFPSWSTYPYVAKFMYAISSPGIEYGGGTNVTVTSTAGVPKTYAASTTGTSVSLSMSTAASTTGTSVSLSMSSGAAASHKGFGVAGVVGAAALAVLV